MYRSPSKYNSAVATLARSIDSSNTHTFITIVLSSPFTSQAAAFHISL